MLRLPDLALPALLAGLLPGTMLLSLLGTTGAAIVLGARRGIGPGRMLDGQSILAEL